MAGAYNCHCTGPGGTAKPCPKIKGTADDPWNHIGVDALSASRLKGVSAGKNGPGAYKAEFHAAMHFRNDDNRGNTPIDCVVIYRPGQNIVCDGLHVSENMGNELLVQMLDALAKRRGANCFGIYNHDEGDENLFDTWNRAGWADLADRLSDALAEFAVLVS